MTRRKQKFTSAKSRTMWLAWCAWGVIGSIFVFEDTRGGSGWMTLLLTAPFWLMFAAWPFLWLWLKFNKPENAVDMDDDIVCEDSVVRVVCAEGICYVEKANFEYTFGCKLDCETCAIPGGDEEFVTLADVGKSQAASEKKVAKWLETVRSLEIVAKCE